VEENRYPSNLERLRRLTEDLQAERDDVVKELKEVTNKLRQYLAAAEGEKRNATNDR